MTSLRIKILLKVIMKVTRLNKKKNFIAKSLKNSVFKQKIIQPKKGKGSFKRKKTK